MNFFQVQKCENGWMVWEDWRGDHGRNGGRCWVFTSEKEFARWIEDELPKIERKVPS